MTAGTDTIRIAAIGAGGEKRMAAELARIQAWLENTSPACFPAVLN